MPTRPSSASSSSASSTLRGGGGKGQCQKRFSNLFPFVLSKLARWVGLDGKYVRSRLGGVVFGVRAK